VSDATNAANDVLGSTGVGSGHAEAKKGDGLTPEGVREHARQMLADPEFRESLRTADVEMKRFFRSIGLER
jgi:hypothetical protein